MAPGGIYLREQLMLSRALAISTKAYVAKVKDLTSKLEAACKKANITLAR
jgi:hypothetical protein